MGEAHGFGDTLATEEGIRVVADRQVVYGVDDGIGLHSVTRPDPLPVASQSPSCVPSSPSSLSKAEPALLLGRPSSTNMQPKTMGTGQVCQEGDP